MCHVLLRRAFSGFSIVEILQCKGRKPVHVAAVSIALCVTKPRRDPGHHELLGPQGFPLAPTSAAPGLPIGSDSSHRSIAKGPKPPRYANCIDCSYFMIQSELVFFASFVIINQNRWWRFVYADNMCCPVWGILSHLGKGKRKTNTKILLVGNIFAASEIYCEQFHGCFVFFKATTDYIGDISTAISMIIKCSCLRM